MNKILGAFFILGFPLASSVSANTELARINSKVITLEEFNEKYQENLKFFPAQPPSKESVLDDLIKRELAIQEAKKLNLDKDPDVQERMETVLYQAVLERQLSKQFEKIFINDDEAEAFYRQRPELRTSHIFIEVRPGASKEDDKKALDRIRNIYETHVKPGKMSFAEIAQKFSEGVAAPMGGDIDYQTRDRLDPQYYDTALKLREPGKVSGIVRTRFGYHIIRLTAVRSWKDVDRAKIKRLAFEERRQKLFEEYMSRLRKSASVQVKSNLLK
jgi:peptidyl-prolyl cis-trans isomerase C